MRTGYSNSYGNGYGNSAWQLYEGPTRPRPLLRGAQQRPHPHLRMLLVVSETLSTGAARYLR